MNQSNPASTIGTEPPVAVATETSIRKRVPLAPDEPSTLVEVFEYVARVHQRPDTLNYKRDGRWLAISSAEMLKRAHHIAAGLYSLGVRSGDRVACFQRAGRNGP